MRILVTNDDGVNAEGLIALVRALNKDHQLTILAPDRNWSASGHVKTMHRPLRVKETHLKDGTPALTTDGAPSDCVALALLGLVDGPIDLVVSGINPHANLGHDVTYSGTVTAAMEAAISGVPGVAFSLDSPSLENEPLDYQPAAEVARWLVNSLGNRQVRSDLVLNVNIPYGALDEMRGVTITRQGLRVYRDELVRRKDPKNKPYFWIGGEAPTGVDQPGTDFWALGQGMVSITPLKLDLTDDDELTQLESWSLSLT